MDSIVASASSGVTSSSIVASPTTWMLSLPPCRLHRLQLLAAEASEAEFEGVPHDRLLDGVGVRGELVADRRSDEVGAIGIETFAHQEIDMAKVDEAEVDRDLFAVAGPVSQPVNLRSHRCLSIHMDGIWMVNELQEGFSHLKRAA